MMARVVEVQQVNELLGSELEEALNWKLQYRQRLCRARCSWKWLRPKGDCSLYDLNSRR